VSAEPSGDDQIGARKGPDAFRTISEVADELGLPQHVLRFWESRFPQIKPVKRGGGRRYYRPGDVDLLRGVKQLLYGEGYTIRGVQRILREQGGRKLAQAAGLAPAGRGGDDPTFESAAPTVSPSGPELWAPQRRADPPISPPASGPPPVPDPYSLDRSEPVVDPRQTEGPQAERDAALPARGWLLDEQASRLNAALEELKACRRLLAGRS
jgi:DNA-binding transcriptional MerR regulator